MKIAARPAHTDDLDTLLDLYRLMEAEQTALKEMWPLADGFPAPVEDALEASIADPEAVVLLGDIDGVPVGFALAGTAELLPQAYGERIGVVRFIFTAPAARGVGVGAAMISEVLRRLRERGLARFDVRVLPGHREAKNFFEANGFSARSIVMYHRDEA